MASRTASAIKLSVATVEQFEGLIASGEWAVGTRIPPEPELIRRLGVGRSTVREAVRALEHAGLLEPRQGDGTYVRARNGLSAALMRRTRQVDLLEVLEVRSSIERQAARVAAAQRTDADLVRIAAAQTERRRSARHDAAAYFAADDEFHNAVIEATHNFLLIELWEGLSHVLRPALTIAMTDPQVVNPELPGHDELAEAVADSDEDRAEQAVAVFIEAGAALVAHAQRTARSSSRE